ncbi:carboxypeptidase B-like, partial [Limulus polyphemus]|uniref:Carboxypeptidase B-like n=1 Tax=Limulus polyphemus TaxID=6850 RepID=A0ABM1C417_LIMPO
IHGYLESLASEHSDIASNISIGMSYEGRDLKVIKISGGTLKDKPILWIDSGIHAREWISITTTTYIATQLVEKYNSEEDVKMLVDTFEWYIMPCANPDGYEYSHTK